MRAFLPLAATAYACGIVYGEFAGLPGAHAAWFAWLPALTALFFQRSPRTCSALLIGAVFLAGAAALSTQSARDMLDVPRSALVEGRVAALRNMNGGARFELREVRVVPEPGDAAPEVAPNASPNATPTGTPQSTASPSAAPSEVAPPVAAPSEVAPPVAMQPNTASPNATPTGTPQSTASPSAAPSEVAPPVAMQPNTASPNAAAVPPVTASSPPAPQQDTAPGAALPYAIQVWAQGSSAQRFETGSRIRLRLALRPISGMRNPGGANASLRARRRGIGAYASLQYDDPVVRVSAPEGFAPLRLPGRLRHHNAERLAAHGPGGGLLAALALGDRSALPREDRLAAARAGVAHLLAVSGLHLALIAGTVFALMYRLLRRSSGLFIDRRTPALIAGALAALVYAWMTGFQAPVQRALIFFTVLLLASFHSRVVSPPHRLAAAALVVLCIDPVALFEPGPQLSFVAAAALWLQYETPTASRNAGAATMRILRTSAGVAAATAPVTAFHFGGASPLGWLTNALAIPLTGVFLLPLSLAAALLASFEGALTETLLRLAAWPAERLLAGLRAWSQWLPAWDVSTPGLPALLLCAVLAACALRAKRSLLRFVFASTALLAPSLLPPVAITPGAPRVVALDVGSGDALVVQGKSAALLIDGGRAAPMRADHGERVVVPALSALGVRRLDLLIASHADIDHRGGLPTVVRRVPVGEIWLPAGSLHEPAWRELREAAAAYRVPLYERGAGSAPWAHGDLRVQALWPPPDAVGSRNTRSLVVAVETAGGGRFLSVGDLDVAGETALLRSGMPLAADLLKLGHHGSRTSSSAAFLRAVSPGLALVSAPHYGRFGFPHPEVRRRLEAQGIPWAWTGRDGALVVGLKPLRLRGFGHAPPVD